MPENITKTSNVKHVGHYTFIVKASEINNDWLWSVYYRGEHLNSGVTHMWSLAEGAARQTIARHAQKA